MVSAFERALDGQPQEAADNIEDLPMDKAEAEPDLLMCAPPSLPLPDEKKTLHSRLQS